MDIHWLLRTELLFYSFINKYSKNKYIINKYTIVCLPLCGKCCNFNDLRSKSPINITLTFANDNIQTCRVILMHCAYRNFYLTLFFKKYYFGPKFQPFSTILKLCHLFTTHVNQSQPISNLIYPPQPFSTNLNLIDPS